MSTVPPPASGRLTLPWYLKPVIVAEPTVIVHVAADTTRPEAAEASLGVTGFFVRSAAGAVADELAGADGPLAGGVTEAEADAPGAAVGL
jgi:hypothetical protein